MLADAFRYMPNHREKAVGRFGPMVVFTDGTTVPRSLSEVPPEQCEIWDRAGKLAESPRVRARFHDLLFERRFGKVGEHGIQAAKAYLAVGTADSPPDLEAVDALARAHQLARLMRQDALLTEIREALLFAADQSAQDDGKKPGVFLPLVEVLIDDDCDQIDDLLAFYRTHPKNDAFIIEQIIDLQRARATNDDQRRQLDRDRVEAWLREADRRDPLVAVLHREKAASIARERGLTELAERVVRIMQAAEPVELPRITVEVPKAVTDDEVEEFINSLVGEDWWNSVLRQLVNGPPTGNVEANRSSAAELAEQFPLQALFPKVKMGTDGLPRYSPNGDEDQADDQLAEVELQRLQILGPLFAEALRRAGEQFQPTPGDVEDILTQVGCDQPTASSIARAIDRYHRGDSESAVYTALPLIERCCRDLLLLLDAPLYRVQRESAPGQYPGLGFLLSGLRQRGLDPSWHRFIRTFLTASNGLNFRNEALHGFVDSVNESTAAMILVILLYLATLQPTPSEAHPDT